MKTIYYLMGLVILTLAIATCSSMNMKTCADACGLNGVKEFIQDPTKCECNELMIRYNDSFNGSTFDKVPDGFRR